MHEARDGRFARHHVFQYVGVNILLRRTANAEASFHIRNHPKAALQ